MLSCLLQLSSLLTSPHDDYHLHPVFQYGKLCPNPSKRCFFLLLSFKISNLMVFVPLYPCPTSDPIKNFTLFISDWPLTSDFWPLATPGEYHYIIFFLFFIAVSRQWGTNAGASPQPRCQRSDVRSQNISDWPPTSGFWPLAYTRGIPSHHFFLVFHGSSATMRH